ncbi:diphthine synthase [Methanothermobacter tenebrarum]|uniref:Diphthine synthase n=1 Tax=Methanothermobacter tenebrarum TaxID=680118 RepID=A0A328PEG9_9EURY|nr:diphthine synthase [Methanothermobacter tenebrarum]MBC7100541.1 diphthine synthase [Methanobacteriales archaeon]NPV64206.1 diphthine synthase [Methanobacteriaceae archaeon]RAO79823.1 diphthine synthase [Methanothermobacter tenebrarum]
MLYIIGLGLYDEDDISIKGMKTLKRCDRIFAEFYTAKLKDQKLSTIREKTGKDVKILAREEIEEDMTPLKYAQGEDVALLVPGDPLVATTHSNLILEARKKNIKTRIIHSSSIFSAAPGLAGLQIYKFGKTTTIPFPEKNYFPHSPYLTIKDNLEYNAHTLILLDIKAEENRYMSANEGLEYLLRVEKERKENIIDLNTLAVVLARVGSSDPLIRADLIKRLIVEDFGRPLHCLIIPSTLHFLEAEYLIEIGGAPPDILK